MDIFDTAGRRMRLMDAFGVNPDQKAEQIRIAREMGVLTVDERTKNLHHVNELDKHMQGLTVLPRAIADKPAFAELAQDDIERLAAIENIARDRRQNRLRAEEAAIRAQEPGVLGEIGSGFWRSMRGAVNSTDLMIANSLKSEAAALRAGEAHNISGWAYNPYGVNFDDYREQREANAQRRAGMLEAESAKWLKKYDEDLPDTIPRLSRETQQHMQNYQNQQGFLDSAKYAFSHPEVLGQLLAGSAGAMAPALAATAVTGGVGGAGAATLMMGAGTYATEYGSTLSQRVEESVRQTQKSHADILADRELMRDIEREARIRGGVIGAMEAFSLGVTGWLYKTFRPGIALPAGIAAQTAGGVAGETGAQIVSRGEIYDVPSITAEALLGPIMSAPEVAGFALFGKQQMQTEQEDALQNLDAQAQAVQNSRLRERAPEVFHEHMREIVEQSDSPHVYLDGNALQQSGLMQAFLDVAPEYAPAVQEALATGGSVQMRTEDFATRIMADANLYGGLRPHARLDADGLSLQEIENHAEAELQEDITRLTREMAKMEVAELEQNDVYNHIHGMIMTTGHFEENAARTQAMIATAFFETMAGRMGEKINPLFERMGLRIVKGQHGRQGEGLDQAIRAQTRANYETRIDELFAGNPANLKGAIMIDRSDVLDMLGYGGMPVQLDEGKVVLNQTNHPEMTAEVWKKVPGWLEDPAMVLQSRTHDKRLVFVPEETIGNAPVYVVVEPDHKGLKVHVLVNGYAKDGNPEQAMRDIEGDLRKGNMQYVHKEKARALLGRSGLQLPGLPNLNTSRKKILTEKNLAGYRKNTPLLEQQAWHGTPHRGIENTGFRLNKIGTGEGAQVYGWGMYFASEREVAEFYRKSLTGSENYVDGELLNIDDPRHYLAHTIDFEMGDAENTRSSLEFNSRYGGSPSIKKTAKAALALWDAGERPQIKTIKPDGQIYSVEIPENDVLLDYDAPLTQQPEQVLQRLEKVFAEANLADAWAKMHDRTDITGNDVYQYLANRLSDNSRANHRVASEALLRAGIPGLRYLDGDSRAQGEGSHNFVIWDEALLTPEAAQIRALYQSALSPEEVQFVQTAEQGGMPPVAELSGAEIDAALDADNVVAKVRDWFKANLQGKVVHREGVGDIRISGKSFNKLRQGVKSNLTKARLLPAIPDILQHGEYRGREALHKPRRDNIAAFHFFSATVNLQGQNIPVSVSVAEDVDGNLVYNLTEKPERFLNKKTAQTDPRRIDRAKDGLEADHFTQEKSPGLDASQGTNALEQSIDNSGLNINILNQAPQSPRGQFMLDSNTIVLFENADLSTLSHELGHFFLEAMVGFANDLRHIDGLQGNGTLTEGERGVVRDVDALMDWFGLDLTTWNRMTLEEKRPYHEQFARGFEQYLLEGKAPSFALQNVFARFRAWLLNIYKRADNLNVPLTDEVRQVFGRMLASDEAITLAEQNRSMQAMFATAEEAGMTEEQFAEYQRLGQEAHDAAMDEMQGRSVRDLKYIRTLKSKKLRALQREAADIRAELQMEARREVLSQPVYRAWQILSRQQESKPAPAPKWQAEVDSTKDSLFVAIAKLGGINDKSIRKEWGHEDSIKRPHPHHPVIRKEGGMTLDDMATSLMELGYLPTQYHLNDFYDRFYNEAKGQPQYSDFRRLEQGADPNTTDEQGLPALRLDRAALQELGYTDAQIKALGRKVRAKGGVHPDFVADMVTDADGNPEYDSGDALVKALLEARPPREAIDNLTDKMMLERYGELSSPEALMEAAEMAAHNETRLRVLAIEASALNKAVGGQRVLASAALQLARRTLAGKPIRDIRPQQYTRMEARAAKAAEQARRKGDIATAAAEKRNQLLQAAFARVAWEMQEEAAKQVRYLKRMGKLNPKNIAIEYREQIEGILEKYDLRPQSGKALERRQSLAQWVESERAKGNEPDLPAHVLDELARTPWQNLTPEALLGVVDSIKQIEHLGKLKNRLLVNRKNQDLDAVKSEVAQGIHDNATQGGIINRTATDRAGKLKQLGERFFFSHLRAGILARVFDGDKDGGAFWEHIIRPMNDAANWQTATRTQAVKDLQEILKPLMDNQQRKDKIATDLPDGNGRRRSLSVEEVFAMALNMGNAGNKQRLLDGNGWTEATVLRQLSRLSEAELNAVQAVWDYFERFKPQVAELERRTKGVEPEWIEAQPLTVISKEGKTVTLRGGYYPVRYDSQASVRAQQDNDALDDMRAQQMRTSMTTRQSYTKSRVAEVHDRPLMLDLSGLFTGLNEVIHDLAYREVLMDTQRLLNSKRVSDAIRDHYGHEAYRQLSEWLRDIAIGDMQRESDFMRVLNKVRRFGTFAYLGYNTMSALMQPLGLLQSAARIGTGRTMAEAMRYIMNPQAIVRKNREANQASAFMADRGSTQMRELNELANSLLVGDTLHNRMLRYSYLMLMTVQKQVDVITWHAARKKALDEGFNDADAVAIADQAVIDTQGSGMIKDLSKVERDNATRIFTVFYSFMNAILNLEYAGLKANNTLAKKAETVILLSLAVPILNAVVRSALKPGDDEDKWGADNWYKTIGTEIVNHHLGMFVGLREVKLDGFNYTGPVGLHIIEDIRKFGEQSAQGEADKAWRKAAINLFGAATGAPSVAINRLIDGAEALGEDDTDNPLVLAVGMDR